MTYSPSWIPKLPVALILALYEEHAITALSKNQRLMAKLRGNGAYRGAR